MVLSDNVARRSAIRKSNKGQPRLSIDMDMTTCVRLGMVLVLANGLPLTNERFEWCHRYFWRCWCGEDLKGGGVRV